MNADAKPTVAATSYAKPTVYRHFHRIAWLAVALALGVIVFGAFVRLSNAGLSCPAWPTCYGRAAWPTRQEGRLGGKEGVGTCSTGWRPHHTRTKQDID